MNINKIKKLNFNLSLHVDELLLALGSSICEFSEHGSSIRGPSICHGGDNPTGFTLYEDPPIWCCWTRGCHEDSGCDLVGLVSSVKQISRKEATDFAIAFLDNKDSVEYIEAKKKVNIDYVSEHLKQRKFTKKIYEKLIDDTSYLESRGYPRSVLTKMNCGLSEYGSMNNRVVFPIKDMNGEPVGFTGRTIVDDSSKWSNTIFRKSINLLNIDICKEFIERKGIKKVILTEGPLDVARLCQAGYWNSMAVMGSAVTNGQAHILKNMGIVGVVLMMDNDEGGQDSELRNNSKLQRAMLDVEVIYPDEEESDVGDMSIKEIRSKLKDINWKI